MIIIGGLKFITSSGNSDRVKSARNTILYAIVGLIIVALAQTIAHFVLAEAANPSVGSCVNGRVQGGPHDGDACS
jgi:hypothetical protein